MTVGWIFLRWAWRCGCGSLLLLACLGEVQAKSPPVWLTNLVAQPMPSQPPEVPALVLLHEQQIVAEDRREWTETIRYAVRLLAHNSQEYAAFSLDYISGTDEVKHITACLIKPDGFTKYFDDSDWVDAAMLGENGLYTDFRIQTIKAGLHAQPGDVFGCEVTIKRKQKNGEAVWLPFTELPATLVQLTLKIPNELEGQVHWIGFPPEQLPEDSLHKGMQRWCWRNLPYEPAETHAPSQPANYVFIKLLAKGGTKANPGTSLADWAGVAKWAAQYQDASCNASANLTATAKKLTAGLDTPAAKLEAICRFVQQCAYASVDKNIGLGFGFQPRLASKILDTRYGDCKDKVNLLRALLREIGITAFPVAVSAETQSTIDPGWPSLLQFNHVIAAIVVPPECVFPAVAEIPSLGRVLFFDPTSEQTPLGTLPWTLQASQGLLCDPRGTGLVQLPKLVESTRWEQHRESDLALRENGLEGEATLELHGELAGAFRQAARQFKESELREKLSAMFARNAVGLTLTEYSFADDWAHDLVTIKVRLKAREVGQKMRNQLWVLRMDLFAHVNVPEMSEHGRRQPFVVTPISDDATLKLKWPAEYAPETVPADAALNGEFGDYRTSYQVREGTLICRRHCAIKGAILTPAQFGEYRRFLVAVAKLDQSTLVLKKPD